MKSDLRIFARNLSFDKKLKRFYVGLIMLCGLERFLSEISKQQQQKEEKN